MSQLLHRIDELCASSLQVNGDQDLFSQEISQLISEKFNFSVTDAALERKPKADKGV